MLYTYQIIHRGFNVDLNEHALKAIDEKQRIKASITFEMVLFLKVRKVERGQKIYASLFPCQCCLGDEHFLV